MSKWVTVKTFSSRVEADLAKGLLEQNGVQSIIKADDMGGMRPHLALTSGVHLQVAESDAPMASKLLK